MLLGPRERIAERLPAFASAGVTTLSVSPFAPDLGSRVAYLRAIAEIADELGLRAAR